jgi:uncharacterized protein (UPF0276 family)
VSRWAAPLPRVERPTEPGAAVTGTSPATKPAPQPIPATAGIGLRTAHHDDFLARRPALDWVEVHSENFFAEGGRPLAVLEAVRRDRDISLHGVGASLGSADHLYEDHLARLRRLVDRFQPALVSEHLCWGAIDGVFLNDLLPLPHTAEALDLMVDRVGRLQDMLRRQVLIENISSYLVFAGDEMSEPEFLARLVRRSGCGILLDVNNLYVNSRNHGFDPSAWLAALPAGTVGEIHLAGYSLRPIEQGEMLVDTHSRPVSAPVWALYREALARFGPLPTLIEWDAELPPLEDLLAEAAKAGECLAEAAAAEAHAC